MWIVVPVTLALFCALHWMSMRQSYAHYMRNLRGSSDYKEKKRQLREIKLAERDQAKGAAKRNKKCALACFGGAFDELQPLCVGQSLTVFACTALNTCVLHAGLTSKRWKVSR